LKNRGGGRFLLAELVHESDTVDCNRMAIGPEAIGAVTRLGEREEIGEIGNFLGWYYIRDDIVVSLVPQATEGPGDEPVLCVRSIRTTG
jgi:hypothetical protein